jgi:para-aminobenzoate synthetase component 1
MVPPSAAFTTQVLEWLPPAGSLRRVALASPWAVLLESSLRQPGYGERDILFLDPVAQLVVPAGADRLAVSALGGPPQEIAGNPFDAIETLLRDARAGACKPGWFLTPPVFAGYISYEAGRFAECMPPARAEGPNLPDVYLVCPATIVVADTVSGTTTVSTLRRGGFDAESLLRDGPPENQRPGALPECLERRPGEVQSSLDARGYMAAVERTIDYIRRGDIFQANIARHLFIDRAPDPALVYDRLARLSPAPYSAWIDLGSGNAVLSSSMELFLRLRGRSVTTRPIKGTVGRGATPEEDEALRSSLSESVKDHAELTMIIDVERNDIGRVCLPGTVCVPDLYRLETFAHVHHLVATVRGHLRPEAGLGALLKAALPGGSITGAPKVRAMEIIGELEPMRRSVYTGAIGWCDAAGDAEFNVAIRTIMMESSGRAYFPAGCGIVADSVPRKEYEETLHKARGMALALGIQWSGEVARSGI